MGGLKSIKMGNKKDKTKKYKTKKDKKLKKSKSKKHVHDDDASTVASEMTDDLSARSNSHKKSKRRKSKNQAPKNGVDLLQRLMATDDESLRRALLEQYLSPGTHDRIDTSDLLQAIAEYVDGVRTENLSDSGPEVTVARQVASLARLVILEQFGPESETLMEFQMGLAPSFAPKYEVKGKRRHSRQPVEEDEDEEEEEEEDETEATEEDWDDSSLAASSVGTEKSTQSAPLLVQETAFMNWKLYLPPNFDWKQRRREEKALLKKQKQQEKKRQKEEQERLEAERKRLEELAEIKKKKLALEKKRQEKEKLAEQEEKERRKLEKQKSKQKLKRQQSLKKKKKQKQKQRPSFDPSRPGPLLAALQ